MGLLRLLLALAVVAAHAGPAAGLDWLRLCGGPLAVQCFYAISGFYMALVLNETYVGKGAYAAFLHNRVLRLFPLFLATLLATGLVAAGLHLGCGITIAPLACWLEHGPSLPWSHALVLALPNLTLVGQEWLLFAAVEPGQGTLYLTANFHAEPLPAWHFQWIPQAWTVGLELAFYAVAPLLVRRGPGVLAGVVLASLGLRYWLMRGLGLAHDPWTYRFFPTELALFLGGALCWHGYRALRQRGWLRPAVVWGGTVLALALVLGYRLLPDPLHRAPLGLPLLLLALPLWIVCPFHATRQWRFDRALGELSYPVYLVHYLLVFVVDALAQPTLDAHRGSLVLVGSLALAWLGERCIGRRWNAARQRVRAALPGAGATPWSPATNPPQ